MSNHHTTAQPCYERVQITGHIIVHSQLHIGSGHHNEPTQLTHLDMLDNHQETALVCKDRNGNPYLPANSFRGLLRTLANAAEDEKKRDLLLNMMGHADQNKKHQDESEQIIHSRLRAYDARWSNDKTYTSEKRYQVRINPVTRTAEHQKLFTSEVVLPSAQFALTFAIDRLTSQEFTTVLQALLALDGQHAYSRLGRSANIGMGIISWSFAPKKALQVVTTSDFHEWLSTAQHTPLPWSIISLEQCIKPLTPLKLHDWGPELNLQIRPSSPLLIHNGKPQTSDGAPSKVGITCYNMNHEERVLIPGSALQGVLSARIRKIILTRTFEIATTLDLPDQTEQAQYYNTIADYIRDLLFGHTGKSASIRTSDAISSPNFTEHTQFFHAEDRFKGGVSAGKLFNVKAYITDQLTFSIRLHHTCNNAVKTLLVYALRDAFEGDIHIGAGSAYGYGHVHISLANINIVAGVDTFLQQLLQQLDMTCDALQQGDQTLEDMIKARLTNTIQKNTTPQQEPTHASIL